MYIFIPPRWIASLEQWASSKSPLLKSPSFGTQSLCPNLKIPLFDKTKLRLLPFLTSSMSCTNSMSFFYRFLILPTNYDCIMKFAISAPKFKTLIWTFKLLTSFSNRLWQPLIVAREPTDFLLQASTTTFAFLGWNWIIKS